MTPDGARRVLNPAGDYSVRLEEGNYSIYGFAGDRRGIVWQSVDGTNVWHYSVTVLPLHPRHQEYATFLEAATTCLAVSAA